ncbi:hypothetical protein N2152v2_008073 [Parachlorella kessleri]
MTGASSDQHLASPRARVLGNYNRQEEKQPVHQTVQLQQTKVFVSGCFDILHGGHVEFFRQAKALGDYLVVSVAGEASLAAHKQGRRPSIPTDHKVRLISSLRMVDEVVVGQSPRVRGLDFEEAFLKARPQLLVVTEDDKYGAIKRKLCEKVGAKYVVLLKGLDFAPTSTTQILANIRVPCQCPLRVDFGGAWLDVPRLARPGTFIVNCSITPLVSLANWPYQLGGGLGGSGAYALLSGRDPVQSELDLGVGWQDPAVIRETGLCAWRSGPRPALDFKTSGSFLRGCMALLWTGKPHTTPELTNVDRDYDLVARAGAAAREAVLPGRESLAGLAAAVQLSYAVQLREGMAPLAGGHGELGKKYCGGGWGGYALFLFEGPGRRDAFVGQVEGAVSVEPYLESESEQGQQS